MTMKVSIWGCRGSIARSHKDLIKYGGNTSCVEVETETTRIILDMGSGAYDCGQKLVKLGKLKNQHILLSHTHWDHIQGFPFFAPFFIKGSEWNVHAPGGFTATIKDKLSSQMDHDFFPLSIENLEANIDYHDLREGELKVGDVQVLTQYMNHNVLTLGYRLQAPDGTTIAYCTDHEPYDRTLGSKGYTRTTEDNQKKSPDDKHADFFAGVDLLIHDTQYKASEYNKVAGYGHSSVEYVVDMAMAVGVKKLALFHHDPQRTDAQVDEIAQMARDRVKAANGTLEVIASSDSSTLTLESEPKEEGSFQKRMVCSVSDALKPPLKKPRTLKPSDRANSAVAPPSSTQEIVVSHPNREAFQGVEMDGVTAVHLDDDESFEAIVLQRQPALVLVRHNGGDNMLDVCEQVRTQGGKWGKEVPFLVTVMNQATLEAVKEKGNNAGVTDWIVEPFKDSYIRTRIRMGIARRVCRWVPPVLPFNEGSRIETLQSLHVLDTAPEERFDKITRICSKVFDCPLVLVSLVDTSRQWFKSSAWHCPIPGGGSTPPRETSRDISFCGHTILQDDFMVIPDAQQDARFADNPLVADPDGLKIRFYCGCPLRIPSSNGQGSHRVGTLCLIDQRPRDIDESQKALLKEFAGMVEQELHNSRKASARRQTASILALTTTSKGKSPIQVSAKDRSLSAVS